MKLAKAYSILKIPASSTPAEVKSSYRKLALATHPDKNRDDPDAKTKFQEISAAYKRITDPKSALHDNDSDDEYGDGGEPFDMSEDEMFSMFDSMFSDLMGKFGPSVEKGEMTEDELMNHVLMGGMKQMMGASLGLGSDSDGNGEGMMGMDDLRDIMDEEGGMDEEKLMEMMGLMGMGGSDKSSSSKKGKKGKKGKKEMPIRKQDFEDFESDDEDGDMDEEQLMQMMMMMGVGGGGGGMNIMDMMGGGGGKKNVKKIIIPSSKKKNDKTKANRFVNKAAYQPPQQSPKPPQSKPSSTSAPYTSLIEITVGQKIGIRSTLTGFVRYLGPVHYASGDWVGVELVDGEKGGKNNGTVKGKEYFVCKEGGGVFAKVGECCPCE